MHFVHIGNKYINLAQVSLIETIPNEGTYVHFGPGEDDTSILLNGFEEELFFRHLASVEHQTHRSLTA